MSKFKRFSRFSTMCLVAMSLCCCGRDNQPSAEASKRPSVYVTIVRKTSAGDSREFSATVEEGKSVNVSFKTGGQIKSLPFKAGDKVTAGAVLGRLDDVDYQLSLSQVQSQYDQTAAEVGRIEEMYRRNNVSANDYEKAKAGLEQLRIQLDLVKNKLDYTRLIAPVSGVIIDKYMEVGEMTGAGTPVYKLLDTAGLETSVAVPASIYSQRGEISQCYGSSSAASLSDIPLEIINFVPDGDNNALFRLRLRIPSQYRSQLLPGMNMTVRLDFKSDDISASSMVPSRAIFERDGGQYVWVINPEDSTIFAKSVRIIGSPVGDENEVEGLDGDETLVAVGVNHLADKQKVAILGPISDLK